MKPWKTKAIAENPDREWQTRRVIKHQPPIDYHSPLCLGNGIWGFQKPSQGHIPHLIKPRYQVGETVYIKEAWRIIGAFVGGQNDFGIEYLNDARTHEVIWWRDNANIMNYPIDEKIRSPLFMPEKYARYFIKITSVTLQRLQDITVEDAIAEGIESRDEEWVYQEANGNRHLLDLTTPLYKRYDNKGQYFDDNSYPETRSPIISFRTLWDSINKAYPWESKPWVWRYTFKLIS